MLILLTILAFGILFLRKKFPGFKSSTSFNNENGLLKFLLLWVLFGFFTRLDYSELYGCLVSFEPFWDTHNIVFSSISFSSFLVILFAKNQRLRKIVAVFELTYWLTKLIAFQGGYAIGFGGTPSEGVVFFDFSSLIFRLLLIRYLFEWQEFKSTTILVLSFLVISIKICFFTMPLFF